MLFLLLVIVFGACVGSCYHEGMWSNAVRLVNVITAGLIATNVYQPLTTWLEGRDESMVTYSYLLDFLVLWLVFALAMGLLRTATDKLSSVKVRFLPIVDRIGSGVFSAWFGWVMVCFTMMSLHTAPLSREFLGIQPEQRVEKMLAPELLWLGFVQQQSRGALARSVGEGESPDAHVFDPQGMFLPTYATRRAKLEASNEKYGSLRVPVADVYR